LNPSLRVRWLASVNANSFHAMELLLQKQPLIDRALAGALGTPVEYLEWVLQEEYIPPEKFCQHLLPLSADVGAVRELVEVTLTKTMGRMEAMPRLTLVYGAVMEVKNAYQASFPQAAENLAGSVHPWMRQWSLRGPGLVAGVINQTEPDFFVEEATVLVVHPAMGGAGRAYPSYNLACLEGVPADTASALPEILRLTWLLAQLNLDLPKYSERIPPHRLPTVAGLAMIPVVFKAGEANELSKCDKKVIASAVESWMPAGLGIADALAKLIQWWEVYEVMRPAWTDAMQALDRLLAEEGAVETEAVAVTEGSEFP